MIILDDSISMGFQQDGQTLEQIARRQARESMRAASAAPLGSAWTVIFAGDDDPPAPLSLDPATVTNRLVQSAKFAD